LLFVSLLSYNDGGPYLFHVLLSHNNSRQYFFFLCPCSPTLTADNALIFCLVLLHWQRTISPFTLASLSYIDSSQRLFFSQQSHPASMVGNDYQIFPQC
jgi:hypothetical protein